MKEKTLIVYLMVFAMSIFSALAETIELKDGKKIVGKIIEATEEAIVVSKDEGNFIYSITRDRIENIRSSTPEEIEREKKSLHVADKEREKARMEKLKEYRLERYEEEVLAAKTARGSIKIKFSKNRFGVVDVLLNNKVKTSLYVDTGASLVVISEEIADKLGIDYANQKARIQVVLADGSITTAIPITLDSAEVGSSKVNNLSAAISKTPPGPDIDGLLGMSFLRYFHVKLDSRENCLVLEKY